MALPVTVLIAAATMIAKDERAQRAAKSLWDKGVDAWGKWHSGRVDADAETAPMPPNGPASVDRVAGLHEGQAGDLIRFTYTDEHGLSRKRTVGNWRSEGGRLTGYCLDSKQEEAFDFAHVED